MMISRQYTDASNSTGLYEGRQNGCSIATILRVNCHAIMKHNALEPEWLPSNMMGNLQRKLSLLHGAVRAHRPVLRHHVNQEEDQSLWCQQMSRTKNTLCARKQREQILGMPLLRSMHLATDTRIPLWTCCWSIETDSKPTCLTTLWIWVLLKEPRSIHRYLRSVERRERKEPQRKDERRQGGFIVFRVSWFLEAIRDSYTSNVCKLMGIALQETKRRKQSKVKRS